MTSRAFAIIGLVLTVGSAAVPAASAAPSAADRIVSARDATGDVRLIGHSDDLTLGQKRSIDLKFVKVDDLGSKVRFTAKLKRITRSDMFDQMVFVSLRPRRGSGWQADIGISPQQPKFGYATLYFEDGDYENCEPVPTRVQRPAQVSVTVPDRCLPSQKARIRVQTVAGRFRTDVPSSSEDTLNIPGLHRLRSAG